MMQRITTNEPDDSQLEVAMAALRAVLTPEAEGFATRTYYEMPTENTEETPARVASDRGEPA